MVDTSCQSVRWCSSEYYDALPIGIGTWRAQQHLLYAPEAFL